VHTTVAKELLELALPFSGRATVLALHDPFENISMRLSVSPDASSYHPTATQELVDGQATEEKETLGLVAALVGSGASATLDFPFVSRSMTP
jgi:hypothetical protein